MEPSSFTQRQLLLAILLGVFTFLLTNGANFVFKYLLATGLVLNEVMFPVIYWAEQALVLIVTVVLFALIFRVALRRFRSNRSLGLPLAVLVVVYVLVQVVQYVLVTTLGRWLEINDPEWMEYLRFTGSQEFVWWSIGVEFLRYVFLFALLAWMFRCIMPQTNRP